jgi:hypothetical protein
MRGAVRLILAMCFLMLVLNQVIAGDIAFV